MRLDWLSLTQFRSYPRLEWSPDPGVNLLVGSNGSGKSNLLESIAYLATLKSFRSAPDAALISDGSDAAVVRAGTSSEEREHLIEIEIPRSGPRQTQVDKTRPRRMADLLGVLRVVAFLPDDLDLVKRGPAHRRELLDGIAVQLWPGSYLDQTELDRALRHRNAFLKSGEQDDATLVVWDSRVAQLGGKVVARRAGVMELLQPQLRAAYEEIAQEDARVRLTYRTSWGSEELAPASAAEYSAAIARGLERNRRADYERRVTSVGPHRDEPGFELGGHDVRSYGSQGEQRTLALGVKLAAHRALADRFDETPLLLLDDVFSELDPERSAALAKALPADTQTLITSARPEDLPVSGTVWRVEDGVHR